MPNKKRQTVTTRSNSGLHETAVRGSAGCAKSSSDWYESRVNLLFTDVARATENDAVRSIRSTVIDRHRTDDAPRSIA